MAQPVRRLTKTGIDRFRTFLHALRGDNAPLDPPASLLTAPETSEPFEHDCVVERKSFADRLEAAQYLADVFDAIDGLQEDVGLWGWLSLLYFDQVCPPKANGRRSPGRDYRHILEPGYRYGHRHLLAGAFVVHSLHGDDARILLCTRVDQENSFHHELTARQAFISNPAIVQAASLLYFDARTGRPKRRSQESERAPGNLRRFVDVVQQLDVNYDLYSMTAEAILELLPAEFDGWRKKKRRFGIRRKAKRA